MYAIRSYYDETLKSLGKEVREKICEHFSFNRQELYDLIKVNKVKDYNEALNLFGEGHGCRITSYNVCYTKSLR